MSSLYEEKIKVMSYDVDETGRASAVSICNYFQEAGFNHAAILTENGKLLPNPNIAYFLTRLHVCMKKYPLWGESIRVETWLSPIVDRYAIRNFEVYNSKDELIGCGENSAVFYDMGKEQIVIVPEDIKNSGSFSERARPINDPFERLPKLDQADHETAYDVKYSDHDTYRHVNNVRYVDWALNTIPVDVWKEFQPETVEISFRAESSHNNKIQSLAEKIAEDDNSLSFIHRLENTTTGRATAFLRTGWIRRS